MESQPQNPEFRNNPESFTHVLCAHQREAKALVTLPLCTEMPGS